MRQDSSDQKLRCAHCGDVIGTYESIVALVDGEAHETSKAVVTAGGRRPPSACYHAGCYASLDERAV